MTLVVYTSDTEAIVCELDQERAMLEEWFVDTGRHRNDFDRKLAQGIVRVTARMGSDTD